MYYKIVKKSRGSKIRTSCILDLLNSCYIIQKPEHNKNFQLKANEVEKHSYTNTLCSLLVILIECYESLLAKLIKLRR